MKSTLVDAIIRAVLEKVKLYLRDEFRVQTRQLPPAIVGPGGGGIPGPPGPQGPQGPQGPPGGGIPDPPDTYEYIQHEGVYVTLNGEYTYRQL